MSRPTKSPYDDHVARELWKWLSTARQAADHDAYTRTASLATATNGVRDKTAGAEAGRQRTTTALIVAAIVIDLRRLMATDLIVQARKELARADLLQGTLVVGSARSVRDVAFACTDFSAKMVLIAIDGEADPEFIEQAGKIAGPMVGASLVVALHCSDPAPDEMVGCLPQLSACRPGWGADLAKLLCASRVCE